MSNNEPKFYVYTAKDRGKGKKAFWICIGAAWATKNGKGVSINLDALPTDGKLILMPPKSDGNDAPNSFEGELGA